MNVARRVIYEGRVQGVGFRYTAQHLAHGFLVAGWVRNLSTGQVELLAEGPADEVDRFLAALGQRMGHTIDRGVTYDEPVTGCRGFRIRT